MASSLTQKLSTGLMTTRNLVSSKEVSLGEVIMAGGGTARPAVDANQKGTHTSHQGAGFVVVVFIF